MQERHGAWSATWKFVYFPLTGRRQGAVDSTLSSSPQPRGKKGKASERLPQLLGHALRRTISAAKSVCGGQRRKGWPKGSR